MTTTKTTDGVPAVLSTAELERMVREAGWSGIYTQWISPTERQSMTVPVTPEQVAKFAELVAEAEREACAKENKRLQALNYELLGLLARCRPIIESDALMMADISRHAPLDFASQAEHDSTEYESEKLVRELESLLGPRGPKKCL